MLDWKPWAIESMWCSIVQHYICQSNNCSNMYNVPLITLFDIPDDCINTSRPTMQLLYLVGNTTGYCWAGGCIIAVMIDVWIATGTCDNHPRLIYKTPSCDNDIIFDRQVILNGITHIPQVDLVVTIDVAQPDSHMMTQLRCLAGNWITFSCTQND